MGIFSQAGLGVENEMFLLPPSAFAPFSSFTAPLVLFSGTSGCVVFLGFGIFLGCMLGTGEKQALSESWSCPSNWVVGSHL